MNSTADAELCRAFFEGDTTAFGTLMQRHQRVVFNVVRRYVANRDDAMDLVQQAFLQAFQAAREALRRASSSEEPFQFRAWVLRIAVNLGKNSIRHSKRRPLVAVEAIDREREAPNTVQAAVERAESENAVRHAVEQLTERQAQIFSLRIDAGLSFAEVAAALGISETNAKTQFHQTVKKLREVVQARTATGGDQ